MVTVLKVEFPLFEGLIESGLELGSRWGNRHFSLIFLDLDQLLMRNVVLHRVVDDKFISEFYLLLLIDLLFKVFCLVLVAKVIISVAKVHKNEEYHDASYD